MFGHQDVGIPLILDNIESCYKPKTFEFKTDSGIILTIGYPNEMSFEDNKILISYVSGIQSLKKDNIVYPLDEKSRKQVIEHLSTAELAAIEYKAIEVLSNNCVILDIPNTDQMELDIMSPSIFYTVFYIYKENLDNFYSSM